MDRGRNWAGREKRVPALAPALPIHHGINGVLRPVMALGLTWSPGLLGLTLCWASRRVGRHPVFGVGGRRHRMFGVTSCWTSSCVWRHSELDVTLCLTCHDKRQTPDVMFDVILYLAPPAVKRHCVFDVIYQGVVVTWLVSWRFRSQRRLTDPVG